MILSDAAWTRYIERLRKVNETAAELVTKYIETHDVGTAAGRAALIDYAYAVCTRYGEGAAALACEMYDATALASGQTLPLAEPAQTPSYGEVARTVQGVQKQSLLPQTTGSAVGRLVKRTGVDTTMQNALRDGAEWAWIPRGDTCSFCLMLASNGWQRASKKALKNGHAQHIHANCDCTYAVRYDGVSTVAGYDPDALFNQYYSAEGDTWQEKVNSMRRDQYAANADTIRAQKREAYAERKDRTNGLTSGSEGGKLKSSNKPEPLKLEDIQIGRGLGAARKAYDIMDLATDEHFDLVDGSFLRSIEVFAGKGTKTPYRDAYKYADTKGGREEDWQHVKAIGDVDYYGEPRGAEIHWSRCEGFGDHDYFIKKWLE